MNPSGSFWLVVFTLILFPFSAPGLVMRENGPEPVIVEIKESLRTSDELDPKLNQLTALHHQNGLQVVKRWAGEKFLVMLSFPAGFTEQRALAVIEKIQRSPAVEKVVAVSAYNLEFKSGDFAREYGPNEAIPDVARRGFDKDRRRRGPAVTSNPEALLKTPHAANRLIVRWKDEHVWKAERTGFVHQMADLHRNNGCRVVAEHRRSDTQLSQVLEFDDPSTLAEKLRKYRDSGLVEYAQPDFVYKLVTIPNDPVYAGAPGPQWSLPIISAPQAWDITTGDHSVIIAVGDSGAPVDGPPAFPSAAPHPDFAENLWDGQNNIPAGEIHNFYGNDNRVVDGFGHGTHVASIIGARGNNSRYMTGVAWDVSLMILKVIGPEGHFSPVAHSPEEGEEAERDAFSSSVSGAISYASAKGATAINLSVIGTYFEEDALGNNRTYMYDLAIADAIAEARDHQGGMLVVAAAGNGQSDNDYNTYRFSPTSIPSDNVISVGATDRDDERPFYSNYGRYRVDLGAPGGLPPVCSTPSTFSTAVLGLWRIFNTNGSVGEGGGGGGDGGGDPPPAASHTGCFGLSGNYAFTAGTSMAAPHVSGAVALVKSEYEWENYHGIRDRILMAVDHVPVSSTDSSPRFEGIFRTKGRLNAFKALHKRTLIRNISTRARVEEGDRVLIGGFVIGGSTTGESLKVAFRGLGPSVGVNAQKLADPAIELYDSSGASRGSNNDWATDPFAAELVGPGYNLQPQFSNEAAMVRTLPPGAYTVVVRASPGTPYGIGLVEIYELSGAMSEKSRLLNLSTRCIVGTDDEAAIAGMIVGEFTPNNEPINGPEIPDRRVLMRGKGPTLPSSITGRLQDPQLDLRDVGGALLDSNDSWTTIDGPLQLRGNGTIERGDALEEELVEANWFSCIDEPVYPEPCHHPGASQRNYTAETVRESALWPTLRPGAYTTVLRGAGGSTGIGLIEFFEY
jgi:subtilisin family serine protease